MGEVCSIQTGCPVVAGLQVRFGLVPSIWDRPRPKSNKCACSLLMADERSAAVQTPNCHFWGFADQPCIPERWRSQDRHQLPPPPAPHDQQPLRLGCLWTVVSSASTYCLSSSPACVEAAAMNASGPTASTRPPWPPDKRYRTLVLMELPAPTLPHRDRRRVLPKGRSETHLCSWSRLDRRTNRSESQSRSEGLPRTRLWLR